MGITAEAAEEIDHLFVQHRVVCHQALKAFEFGCIWQVTVEQQIAHFQIMAFRGQLINGIPAMQQDARFPINEGDGRIA